MPTFANAFRDFVALLAKARLNTRPRLFLGHLDAAAARDATSLGVGSCPPADGRGALLGAIGASAALADLGLRSRPGLGRPAPLLFLGGGGIAMVGRF